MSPAVLAWAKDVDREQTSILERTNVNGGAIAIGHRSALVVPAS